MIFRRSNTPLLGSSWSAPVYALAMLALAACTNTLCPDFWPFECVSVPDRDGDNEAAELDKIHAFKNEVAREAGNDAVALRGLQVARVGDIFTFVEEDKSLVGYAGSILDYLSSDQSGVETLPESLSVTTTSLHWTREFESEVGIDFVKLGIKAAFQQSEVWRVDLKLSLSDGSLQRFRNTSRAMNAFESQISDGEIRGNRVVTGIVKGRMKVELAATDTKGQTLSLDFTKLAELMNSLAGSAKYSIAAKDELGHEVLQQSPDASSVYAVILTEFSDQKKTNTEVVAAQSKSKPLAPHYANESEYVVVLTDDSGSVFANAHLFEDSSDGNPNWSLSFELVKPNIKSANFQYHGAIINGLTSATSAFDGEVTGLTQTALSKRQSVSNNNAWYASSYIVIVLTDVVTE